MRAVAAFVARRRGWLVAVVAVASAAPLLAQALSVSTDAGVLRIKAPGLRFIDGPVLDRLREGRSVRLEFELAALSGPKGAVIATERRTFNLSLDLWEERVAVTRDGAPPLSISHLRPADAEAWCLDRMTMPVASLGRLGQAVPFWLRLEYRIQDEETIEDAGFTLRRLIDALSRRRKTADVGKSVEAGPFRIQ